jgi:hypothetical protein
VVSAVVCVVCRPRFDAMPPSTRAARFMWNGHGSLLCGLQSVHCNCPLPLSLAWSILAQNIDY